MSVFCGQCGKALSGGAAHCGHCGAATRPAAVSAPSPSMLVSSGTPPGLIASASVSSRVARPDSGMGQYDDLQKKMLARGDAIAQSFGGEQTGVMKHIVWLIRSTCLDRRVARAAAEESGGTGAAIAVLIVISLPTILFGAITAVMRAKFIPAVGMLSLVTLLTWAITFFALSIVSTKLVEVKLPVSVLIRVLTYPQTVTVLGAIPLLGRLIGPLARIWSIVASAEAIREVTGVKAEKAILFTAFGALVYACAWMALSVIAARLAMRF
jgi:hypothetical protein